MDIAIYFNGLSKQCFQVLFPVQSVYMASEVSLLLQAKSNHVSRSKERKFNIWQEKQCFECLIRNILLKAFNPKCTVGRTQYFMPNSISTFLQTWSFPLETSLLQVQYVFVISPLMLAHLTFFTVGKASFLHKLWPHWTASCMQRLLDIPWLTDHSSTSRVCDLARSEGAHHC